MKICDSMGHGWSLVNDCGLPSIMGTEFGQNGPLPWAFKSMIHYYEGGSSKLYLYELGRPSGGDGINHKFLKILAYWDTENHCLSRELD